SDGGRHLVTTEGVRRRRLPLGVLRPLPRPLRPLVFDARLRQPGQATRLAGARGPPRPTCAMTLPHGRAIVEPALQRRRWEVVGHACRRSRERKKHEYRVAITPAGVRELTERGHEVSVETEAGVGAGITDEEYLAAGAKILPTAEDVWGDGDLVLKVKEPIAEEYGFLRRDLTLFTFLHLAADRELTEALLAAGTTAIAYET